MYYFIYMHPSVPRKTIDVFSIQKSYKFLNEVILILRELKHSTSFRIIFNRASPMVFPLLTSVAFPRKDAPPFIKPWAWILKKAVAMSN